MRASFALVMFMLVAACTGSKVAQQQGGSPPVAPDGGAVAGGAGVYSFNLSGYPPDIRPKLLADAGEAAACRNPYRGGAQTIAACDRLEQIHTELESDGWCRGPDTVETSKRHWMRCGPHATRYN